MANTTSEEDEATVTDFPVLEPLFHDDHVLELQTYLDIFSSLGNGYRLATFYLLYSRGELSAKEIEETLGLTGNSIHYHLRKLSSAGLINNERRKTTDDDGVYSYYALSPIGDSVAKHVVALFKEQREALGKYTSDESAGSTSEVGLEIRELLTADDPDVQKWAVSSLAELAAIDADVVTEAVSEIRDLLKTDDLDVRVHAVQALRQIAETQPIFISDKCTETLKDSYRDLKPQNYDDYCKCKEFLEHGRQIHRITDNRRGEALATYNLARLAEDHESPSQVRRRYQESQQYFEDIGDKGRLTDVLYDCGTYEISQGNYVDAQTYFEEGLERLDENTSPRVRARYLRNLGTSLRLQGEFDRAKAKYRESIECAEKVNAAEIIANSREDLGTLYRSKGESTTAHEHFEAALAEIEDENDALEARLRGQIGITYGFSDDHESARDLLNESLELYENTDDARAKAPAHYNLGVAYKHLEEIDEAKAHFRDSIEQYREQGEFEGALEVALTLIETAENAENVEEAIEHSEYALDILTSAREEMDSPTKSDELAYYEWHIQARKARLKNDVAVMQEVYADSLKMILNGEQANATEALRSIWEQHSETDADADTNPIIESAGVGLHACIFSNESQSLQEIQDSLRTNVEESELTEAARVLYDALTSELDDATTEGIDAVQEKLNSTDFEEWERTERKAYHYLLQQLYTDYESEVDTSDIAYQGTSVTSDFQANSRGLITSD